MISTQEELSICCRWLVNGSIEEHFLTILHVTSTDALTSFIREKNLDSKRLVGQGYDGVATFSCRRIRVHAAHALYIHCSFHRVQLTSIQAAESVGTIKNMFRQWQHSVRCFTILQRRQKL